MTDIVITSAVRTPIGAFCGSLAGLEASDLGEIVIGDALSRSKIDGADVSEVVMGQVLTAGTGQNPARQASVGAGVPKEVPAMTINQVCGSGLKAVALGASSILAGDNCAMARKWATPNSSIQ
jgi:acetyl-CoA C-acetyltransferase